MKKFLCILINDIVAIMLVLLAINLTIKDILVDTISEIIIKREISDMVTDIIYRECPDINSVDIMKIDEVIQNSSEVKDITDKYFSNIMGAINENDDDYLDIDDELENLIENNRDKLEDFGLSDDKIDKISKDISSSNRVSETYEIVKDNVRYNLTDEQKRIVNIYNILNSNSLRYGLIIGIVLGIIIIGGLSLKKFSFIIYTGISSFIAGLFVRFGVINIIKMFAWEVTNKVLGRTSDIYLDSLCNISRCYIVIGVLLIIIYLILRKISNRKENL